MFRAKYYGKKKKNRLETFMYKRVNDKSVQHL